MHACSNSVAAAVAAAVVAVVAVVAAVDAAVAVATARVGRWTDGSFGLAFINDILVSSITWIG